MAERAEFFKTELFQNTRTGKFIIGGDWNCVTRRQDVSGHFKEKHCRVLSDLVRQSEWTDCWVDANPGVSDFTFIRPRVDQARHDRVYASAGLGGLIAAQHILTLSDHKAVMVDFEVAGLYKAAEKVHAKSYWKLNTKVLEEEDFEVSFREVWDQILLEKPSEDVRFWWDKTAKPAIQKFCKWFLKVRQKNRKTMV